MEDKKIEDEVVKQVVSDLIKRSELGIKKYGTTLAGNNTDNFKQHLYEELLDSCNYLKKLLIQEQKEKDEAIFLNKHIVNCFKCSDAPIYQNFSTMDYDGTKSLSNGVYRSRLTTSGRTDKIYWTKDKKYWARTKDEIKLFNKYEDIFTLVYISGLVSPFHLNNKNLLGASAIDGYQMHIIGKLKKNEIKV